MTDLIVMRADRTVEKPFRFKFELDGVKWVFYKFRMSFITKENKIGKYVSY